jgi:hypothetical protein
MTSESTCASTIGYDLLRLIVYDSLVGPYAGN